jgi:hypothetical protein
MRKSEVLSKRGLAFAFIAVLVGYAFVSAVIADMHTRRRIESTGIGVNSWGYQGPAAFRKKAGEKRIALLGGSAAFGLGNQFEQSPASLFQYALSQGWRKKYPGKPTSIVGLAEIGAGAGSYVTALTDYAYLDPDVICVYDGYAPVEGFREFESRRESAVFRTIGYLPNLFDHRRSQLPDRVDIAPALKDGASGDPSCGGVSAAYCAAMTDTVDWGLSHGKGVIVVTPPYVSKRHQAQQDSLAERLKGRFGRDHRFVYLNEGPSLDLHNPKFSKDGIHLTPAGINTMADNLADPFFDATRRR